MLVLYILAVIFLGPAGPVLLFILHKSYSMCTLKLSPHNYQSFVDRWSSGEFTHQRLGQAFCNQHGINHPALFYEMSDAKAKIRIREEFVDWALV